MQTVVLVVIHALVLHLAQLDHQLLQVKSHQILQSLPKQNQAVFHQFYANKQRLIRNLFC